MSPLAHDTAWDQVNYRALVCLPFIELHSVQYKTSVEVQYQSIGSLTNFRNELILLFLTVVILCSVSPKVGVQFSERGGVTFLYALMTKLG